MIDEDMGVFFDADDHADVFSVVGLPPPDNTVTGIFGVTAKDALQGYAVGVQRELRYPASSLALRDGDELERGSLRYKVRGEPEPQNDGQEMLAVLSEVRP